MLEISRSWRLNGDGRDGLVALCRATSFDEATRRFEDFLATMNVAGYALILFKRSLADAIRFEVGAMSRDFESVLDAGRLGEEGVRGPLAKTLVDARAPVVLDSERDGRVLDGLAGGAGIGGSLGKGALPRLAVIPLGPALFGGRATLLIVPGSEVDAARPMECILQNSRLLWACGRLLLDCYDEEVGSRDTELLSKAERRVLEGLAAGLTPSEIAEASNRSLRTIRNQIESARVRLEARTTAEAVAIACRNGLILT